MFRDFMAINLTEILILAPNAKQLTAKMSSTGGSSLSLLIASSDPLSQKGQPQAIPTSPVLPHQLSATSPVSGLLKKMSKKLKAFHKFWNYNPKTKWCQSSTEWGKVKKPSGILRKPPNVTIMYFSEEICSRVLILCK